VHSKPQDNYTIFLALIHFVLDIGSADQADVSERVDSGNPNHQKSKYQLVMNRLLDLPLMLKSNCDRVAYRLMADAKGQLNYSDNSLRESQNE
jgi:hypothetical protein